MCICHFHHIMVEQGFFHIAVNLSNAELMGSAQGISLKCILCLIFDKLSQCVISTLCLGSPVGVCCCGHVRL